MLSRRKCLCRQFSGASSLPEVVPSSSWEIKPEDITIAKHSDGSDWELGSGGFGKVYPGRIGPVIDVAYSPSVMIQSQRVDQVLLCKFSAAALTKHQLLKL